MRPLRPLVGIVSVSSFLIPLFAKADAVSEFKAGLNTANSVAGLGTTDSLPVLIGNIINAILGISGIAMVLLLVYAGILYMQGGTDEQKVKQAKGIITNAVIGIVIIVTAYAITSFFFTQLSGALG